MIPELNDSLRVLAGIAGSEHIDKEIKERAHKSMKNIMDMVDKFTALQSKQLDKVREQTSDLIV